MKFIYEFTMKEHDCFMCPFLRAEAFGNRYFCKGQDIKRKAKNNRRNHPGMPIKNQGGKIKWQ